MVMLQRSDWYDIARDTNWTPKYVTEAELFPDIMSDEFGVPLDRWESYDEPYKCSFREYVKIQRDKDAGAYSVKAALGRMNFYEKADPGWLSILKAHYGAIATQEYAAGMSEARMVRFGKAPGMRNMATFGLLDETRHGQIQLYFPHEFVSKDSQFDWAHRAMHTNEWAAIAARQTFADLFSGRDAISVAIMLTFAFETGFTNMQFLGLAADAAQAGDMTFSNLISSIQTDECRHAQIGAPALKILIREGKKEEAQKKVDIAFWRSWRLFTVLTGPMMDYYTPLDKRESSFKEFMEEWIIGQFERNMIDMGLDKPWYWDIFLEELDDIHHGMHLGVWYWRPTAWWNPAAGAGIEEREWLEAKYPGWNDSWGQCWDVITKNILEGRKDLTLPETLPIICNMSNLPIVGAPGKKWGWKNYPLDYKGRRYNFGSQVDRWCFQQEPERYAGHLSLIDRFLVGQIQPANLEGALQYMGLAEHERGVDAHNFAWAERFRGRQAAE